MPIDVFLDVVYTQTDTGEWIEIDFNDYITRPLDDSEKEYLKVILNKLKATSSKDSKYYDIFNGSRKYIKHITKRKTRRNFKKRIDRS